MRLDPKRSARASFLVALLAGLGPWLAPRAFGQAAQRPGVLVEREAGLSRLRLPEGQAFHQTSAAVEDARSIAIPGGDGLLALWSERGAEGGVPHYALSLDGRSFARARATSYELHLVRARFDPLRGEPDFGDSPLVGGGELWIVQFVAPPIEAFDEALVALGASVHHFVPMHGRIVRMPSELVRAVAELPFVRWVGPYHPEYRLEPYLLEKLRDDRASPALRYQIQVLERGPRQKQLVAERIEASGGRIEALIPEGFLLEATLAPELLAAVASMDEVLFVDRWTPNEEDLNLVRSVGGADFLTGLTGYTGRDVRGEVMDSNVRATHVAFQSNPILFHGPNGGDSSHGTQVMGCVFGDGASQPQARGILPDGQPIFADHAYLTNRYAHTQQLLQAPYFAVFQTNSWGGSLTTSYTTTSAQMDDILFAFDIVILQSQSNSGSQLSRPQAWAKNILSVGAVNHQNTAALGDDAWSGTGSIGPAADGRIKPDLCFWYDSIWTTSNSSDTAYSTGFGGTSAATPCTAGYLGLVQEMWSEGLFGNTPSGSSVFERRARAATARALLVNGARQYGFSGTGHDLTRTHQGWGLPDVQRIYERRERTFVVDGGLPLRMLESASYELEVEPGESLLAATLCYIDPSGTTSASIHRINDLSLRVSSPGGLTYWGNNGLLAGSWSTPGGGSNTKDVLEQVLVQNPQAGTWRFEVLADELNQDAWLGTPERDATFSLVVSGVLRAPPCPQPSSYCAPSPGSGGSLPLLGHAGSVSIAANDFRLLVTGGAPSRFAMPLWSAAPANLGLPGATLCIAAPYQRGDIVQLDLFGDGELPIDISGRTPGQREYFQVWIRDAAGSTTFALSDALEVGYCD